MLKTVKSLSHRKTLFQALNVSLDARVVISSETLLLGVKRPIRDFSPLCGEDDGYSIFVLLSKDTGILSFIFPLHESIGPSPKKRTSRWLPLRRASRGKRPRWFLG